MELISIVIPHYNRPDALQKSLESIEKQTYKNVEVVVVDDGSDVGLRTSDFGLQFQYYRQENRGAPAARNKGFELSKGEYVIFWDADLVAKPEILTRLVKALEGNPDASYAYCNYHYGFKAMPARAFDAQALKQRNYIHSSSLIRRKDAVRWDESLKKFQDWDLWLTMLGQGKRGVWVDEYLFRLLPSESGISDWLPRFAYYPPFKWLPGVCGKVKRYEEAREVIREKHEID